MELPDSIVLRADEKVVKNSAIFTWVIIFAVGLGGMVIAKKSLDDGGDSIGYGLSLFFAIFIIWLTSTLLSVDRKLKRQLRDQTVLYTLTKGGITNGYGHTYIWSDFKKIYYYKTSVQLLEKDKIINAVVFSPSGIDPIAYKEACLFIKKHAPPEITKSFKPR